MILFVETDLNPIEAGSWGTPRGSCLAYRTRALWDAENQDQARADQIRSLTLTQGEGRGEGGHEPRRHLRVPGPLELGKLPVAAEITFVNGFPLAPWRLS